MVGKRSHNPHLAKIHRNYSVEEVAKLLGVHKNAVRDWIKRGLKTVDARRPTLIRGRDLVDFLEARRARSKRPCAPGELYCLRCRAPRKPANGVVDYQPITSTTGNLIGRCSVCDATMFQRVRLSNLDRMRGFLVIRFTEAA